MTVASLLATVVIGKRGAIKKLARLCGHSLEPSRRLTILLANLLIFTVPKAGAVVLSWLASNQ